MEFTELRILVREKGGDLLFQEYYRGPYRFKDKFGSMHNCHFEWRYFVPHVLKHFGINIQEEKI